MCDLCFFPTPSFLLKSLILDAMCERCVTYRSETIPMLNKTNSVVERLLLMAFKFSIVCQHVKCANINIHTISEDVLRADMKFINLVGTQHMWKLKCPSYMRNHRPPEGLLRLRSFRCLQLELQKGLFVTPTVGISGASQAGVHNEYKKTEILLLNIEDCGRQFQSYLLGKKIKSLVG